MKIFDLLNEILVELDNSRRQRFGAKKTIDADVIISILQEIRQTLPEEIVEAQKIVENRERILAQAKEQAQDIVLEAKTMVKDHVEGHRVTRMAQDKRDEILKDARREAYEIRCAANDYAIEVLDDVGVYLNEYRNIIKENRTNFLNRMNREEF